MTEEEEDSNMHQHIMRPICTSSEENYDSNSEKSTSAKGAPLDIGQLLTFNGSAKPTPRGGAGGTGAANRRYMQLVESQMSE